MAKSEKKKEPLYLYEKWWFWIIIAVIMWTIVGIIFSSNNETMEISNNSSQNTNTEKKVSKSTEQIYNIGDTITTKKYEITIEDVSERTKVGGEYFSSTPSEGGIYVAVDYKYKNISSEPLSSWNFPSVKLLDSKGNRYSADINASSNYATEKNPDRKILSDLNPGITVTDNDIYEISSENYNSGEWFLLIDNKIKVKVK